MHTEYNIIIWYNNMLILKINMIIIYNIYTFQILNKGMNVMVLQ